MNAYFAKRVVQSAVVGVLIGLFVTQSFAANLINSATTAAKTYQSKQ